MDWGRFNINKTVSSLVSSFSRSLRKIAIGRCDLGVTALDIVESAESVAHLEQITAVGWLGWNGRLSGALESAQRVTRLHSQQTGPPKTELRDGQQLCRSNET